jgi:hypothetical protein
MSKSPVHKNLKRCVAYRHRIYQEIQWCFTPENNADERGQWLGLSDLIMEETLLLLGEIEMEEKKQYPVSCDSHGIQAGYIVCIHVFKGEAKANLVQKASMESLGVISCVPCRDEANDDETTDIDGWRCVCAECALQNGWTSGGIQ